MNARYLTAAMVALILASPITSGQTQTTEPAPGAGQPAAGGKGPGTGYFHRRNVGGPGPGRGAQPGQVQRPAELPDPPPMPQAPPQPPATPASGPPPQPGLGYRGHPRWAPGTATPYNRPGPRYGQPGRQGYGYPGYRGRGASPYPGHRQYGNPPGVPAGPKTVD